jgi:hypothetical protein
MSQSLIFNKKKNARKCMKLQLKIKNLFLFSYFSISLLNFQKEKLGSLIIKISVFFAILWCCWSDDHIQVYLVKFYII